MPRRNTEADFWNRVEIRGPDECWLWKGPLTDRRYGKTHFQGKERRAHQVSFFLKNGFWPPATLHSCDNPPCCNANHLFAGTNGDNNKDRARKGRSARLFNVAHPQCRVSVEDVAELRRMAPFTTKEILAGRFGLSVRYVEQIVQGERRKQG